MMGYTGGPTIPTIGTAPCPSWTQIFTQGSSLGGPSRLHWEGQADCTMYHMFCSMRSSVRDASLVLVE